MFLTLKYIFGEVLKKYLLCDCEEAGANDSSDLDGEEAVLDRLHIPGNPDFDSVMTELDHAAAETLDLDDDVLNFEDENFDRPTVTVDKGEEVLAPVACTLIRGDSVQERTLIENFDCKCNPFKEGNCIRQFSTDHIQTLRMNMSAATAGEKEMYIIGKISCTMNLSKQTKRKSQKDRTRYRTTWMIENKVVCRNAFRFMHCIGNDRLKKLTAAYAADEVEPLERKAGGLVDNTNLITYEDIKRVVTILLN
ncbi:uncharacterized protein LOC135488216 isoform X2 [Lineus longissimus]|uniref:uncharacterized protein LOC135488216 isoform X2 n=1 Tax=Lineus longissimus TaxID=88925 RepID=UPI002B4CDF4C